MDNIIFEPKKKITYEVNASCWKQNRDFVAALKMQEISLLLKYMK